MNCLTLPSRKDTATQTDPITIIDCSSIKFNKHKQPNRRTAKTKSSNKQRNQKSNKDTYRGEKNRGWPEKKGTIEMIKKRFEETTTERKTSKKSFITI